ncbi:MAG: acetate--CoA ligase family protein [Paracoccaceae bacterium]
MVRSLDRLLRPKTIAVYGGGWSGNVIKELKKTSFAGEIWAVHPTKKFLEGVKCYKSSFDLPASPDVAFVGVNREKTVCIIKELAKLSAGGVVSFASGFSETSVDDKSQHGKTLQDKIIAAAGQLPVLGPNCYGFINYLDNALIWPDQHGGERVDSGVAILTQSSNIAINLTMQCRGLPIAYVVTVGNQAQLNQAQIAFELLQDPRVTAVGLHIEGITNPKDFEILAREAKAKKKGIVALKVGKSKLAESATVSHTASMAGSYKGAVAFLNKLAIATVDGLGSFLNALMILHVHQPITGSKIASLSCSGGEASLIADLAEPLHFRFPKLTLKQKKDLKSVLGHLVHLSNPLDYQTYIWNDQVKLQQAFKCMTEVRYDFLCIIMDLPKRSRCTKKAWGPAIAAIKEAKKSARCPVGFITSLEENMPEEFAKDLLRHAIIPLTGLESSLGALGALRDVSNMWKKQSIRSIIWQQWPDKKSRTINEFHSKKILKKIGLNVPKGYIIEDINSLVNKFRVLKKTVALKALGIDHKTDASAVSLGIDNEEKLIDRFMAMKKITNSETFLIEHQVNNVFVELLVGIIRDPQHGFMLTIGEGGILSELRKDTVTLCMPCNKYEIKVALKKLRIWPLLNGYRNKKAVNVSKIVLAISMLQRYAINHKDRIIELEINPLLVKSNEVFAADALIRENY